MFVGSAGLWASRGLGKPANVMYRGGHAQPSLGGNPPGGLPVVRGTRQGHPPLSIFFPLSDFLDPSDDDSSSPLPAAEYQALSDPAARRGCTVYHVLYHPSVLSLFFPFFFSLSTLFRLADACRSEK